MRLVVDASVALAWIFEREKPAEATIADRVLLAIVENETIMPALWHLEVANALLVGERRKAVSEAQIVDYLTRLDQLPINTDPASPAARRDTLMALAREYKLTAYDAAYLELAMRMDATLATFDAELAAAMKRAGGRIFR